MLSVLRQFGLACVALTIVLASTNARSVDIASEVLEAANMRDDRGLNANFSLIDSLPRIDTDKDSKFNTSALQTLFNTIYSPQNGAIASVAQDNRFALLAPLQAREDGSEAVEITRQARAGIYYSPDDKHFFQLSGDDESAYPQYANYPGQSVQQQRAMNYHVFPEVEAAFLHDSSNAQTEDEARHNSDAQARFFVPFGLGSGGSIGASAGVGINTGSSNAGSTSVGTTFGGGSGDGFSAGILKMLSLSKPQVVTINSPSTTVQATPLVTKYLGLPLGFLSGGNTATNNNNNVGLAPSANYGSNGIFLFKGIQRI